MYSNSDFVLFLLCGVCSLLLPVIFWSYAGRKKRDHALFLAFGLCAGGLVGFIGIFVLGFEPIRDDGMPFFMATFEVVLGAILLIGDTIRRVVGIFLQYVFSRFFLGEKA